MSIWVLSRMLRKHVPTRRGLLSGARAAAVLLLLFPYIVGFTPSPSDSSSLLVTVAGGVGSYAHVSRDCSGKVLDVTDVPYDEAAIGVERRFSWGGAGLRGGAFHVARQEDLYGGYAAERSWYINPYAAAEGRIVGLQLGLAFFHNEAQPGNENLRLKYDHSVLPTVRFRFGDRNDFYFLTSFASNMPLGSGGGIYDAGLGIPLGGKGASMWIGFGVTPYEEGCISLKADIPVLENLALNPRLQFRSGDATEYGLALGLTMGF